jgi:SulP family sulfate permease
VDGQSQTAGLSQVEHTVLSPLLPDLSWLKGYTRAHFGHDFTAAVVVTIMLIPQSLAYALLAGLPAEMGLYASILPLIAYALFGSSRTLSVGPVAVIALMTATAVGNVSSQGTADYATAAVLLALLSGAMLILLGVLRFGFVTNFLSHPVVSGFITASGVLIALSQIRHLLGTSAQGATLPELSVSLLSSIGDFHMPTFIIGSSVLLFLWVCRRFMTEGLMTLGVPRSTAELSTKAAPVLAIMGTIMLVIVFNLESLGVALVGTVPQGLPAFTTPLFDLSLAKQLTLPALLISLIGFVESVSVGRTLGAKRGQRINPNKELIALGAANVASAVSAGFPVTGGFSRSVVNFEAGAATQAASIMAAMGIALAALLLTPLLYFLPKATLAATIILAVTTLIDWKILVQAWRFSWADFLAIATTISLTLFLGVEIGVLSGVAVSIGMHLYKTSRPHFAVVGSVRGTEYFRNVQRHDVSTDPEIISIRVDESLYFANAAYLEEIVLAQIASNKAAKHIILMCSAVNDIDLSALEALKEINNALQDLGICLHLSEIKGPVMNNLNRSDFLDQLTGRVFDTQYEAFNSLRQEHMAR